MEKTIFISDPSSLNRYPTDYDRLYFGSEFCARLAPAPAQVKNMLAFAEANKIEFTLVTPIFHDSAYARITTLLDLLPEKTEVVFNDWGLLDAVLERGLSPVHGRLLCSIKKDPRIPAESDFMEYFMSSNLQKPYQELLLSKNVRRVELDNVRQGYNLQLDKRISASIYIPYVQCSVTRKCIFANISSTRPKFTFGEGCAFQCAGKKIETRINDGEITIKGNVQYYVNKTIPTRLREWNVDRMVFMPRFPNSNSFSEKPISTQNGREKGSAAP